MSGSLPPTYVHSWAEYLRLETRVLLDFLSTGCSPSMSLVSISVSSLTVDYSCLIHCRFSGCLRLTLRHLGTLLFTHQPFRVHRSLTLENNGCRHHFFSSSSHSLGVGSTHPVREASTLDSSICDKDALKGSTPAGLKATLPHMFLH